MKGLNEQTRCLAGTLSGARHGFIFSEVLMKWNKTPSLKESPIRRVKTTFSQSLGSLREVLLLSFISEFIRSFLGQRPKLCWTDVRRGHRSIGLVSCLSSAVFPGGFLQVLLACCHLQPLPKSSCIAECWEPACI